MLPDDTLISLKLTAWQLKYLKHKFHSWARGSFSNYRKFGDVHNHDTGVILEGLSVYFKELLDEEERKTGRS